MRSGAPRGEVFYCVASDGGDTPTRVKMRTPSFVNIPAVAAMVQRSDLEPMCRSSRRPSIAATPGPTGEGVDQADTLTRYPDAAGVTYHPFSVRLLAAANGGCARNRGRLDDVRTVRLRVRILTLMNCAT